MPKIVFGWASSDIYIIKTDIYYIDLFMYIRSGKKKKKHPTHPAAYVNFLKSLLLLHFILDSSED